MCGICGIIDLNGNIVNDFPLRAMMHKMKHRGPDDEGIYIEDNVGLGFVRLSIIDLSPQGHQPMVSADGNYIIVFNGEIYNYIELKAELSALGYLFKTKSDTEVLLTSYLHWGEDCMHHFNGMWAFVILDKKREIIFCARDRYGIKPFYYSITDGLFLFASDIPPILSCFTAKPKPNEQAIFDYIVFNRTDQNEKTFFSDVKKLPHGHSISFNYKSNRFDNQISLKKWYNLRSSLNTTFESTEEYYSLFSSSIGLRLRADVPVGVCLSGGLDSSAIVSTLLKDYDKRDLNTFSAVYGHDVKGDESVYINEYHDTLKDMYYITPTGESLFRDLPDFIDAHSEPVPTTSPYAQFKIMELAKKHVVVTLDGQGADEQLAGYHYFYGFYFKELILKLQWLKFLNESSNYFKNHKSIYGLASMSYLILPTYLKTRSRINKLYSLQSQFRNKYENQNSIASTLYKSKSLHDALIDHFEYKLEHLLKWEDRNSMWFSLEARVPFLDYRLVEKTLALPPEKIIKDGVNKYILREALKGVLPERIRLRKDKVGFETPASDWFRNSEFKIYIEGIIKSADFRSRGIFDSDKAERIYMKHCESKIDASGEIWKWINLENWYRKYID